MLTYSAHRPTETAILECSIGVQQGTSDSRSYAKIYADFMLVHFIVLTMQCQSQCFTHAPGLSAQCSNESFTVLYISSTLS